MISSRCNDLFPLGNQDGRTLTTVRKELKKKIEAYKLFGQPIYEVWINELASENAARDSWDRCMKEARDCDIFICLLNGNAGWTDRNGTVGICHAEFKDAYLTAAAKIRVIDARENDHYRFPDSTPDQEFSKEIDELKSFVTKTEISEKQLIETVLKAVRTQTVQLVHYGKAEASKGKRHQGAALKWSRMSYNERVEAMKASLRKALDNQSKNSKQSGSLVVRTFASTKVVCKIAAIPDLMSVSAAREMVGQPHLFDHDHVGEFTQADAGIVHVVACMGSTTEAQAKKMLGFPNATVIPGPFGVYVLDSVQAVQFVLIANCIDDTTTRLGTQRFLEWLSQTKQDKELVKFAKKRKKVIEQLAL